MVNDYARVRHVGDGADETAEGWVRVRNISKVERKAGLPDLGQFAQMAIDELVHREEEVHELEVELDERDNELEQQSETIRSLMAQVSQLQEQLATLQAQMQLQTTEAPITTKEPPVGETPLSVGDTAFMLNPVFQDGTRLRVAPSEESEFLDGFILNDAEVEVLEMSTEGTCVHTEP